MGKPQQAITYIDAPRMQRALQAGIRRVGSQREHINKINVFPVADGDTGTNMVFTLRSLAAALSPSAGVNICDYLKRLAGATLDGARGNSGAIMAQYFQGLFEGCYRYEANNKSNAGNSSAGTAESKKKPINKLLAEHLSSALSAAAESAWQAMANPVKGTLPSILEAFAISVRDQVETGCQDIRLLLRDGLINTRTALAQTPEQLNVLRDAGVVDAGAQGFVDLLEGIVDYMETGQLQDQQVNQSVEIPDFEVLIDHDDPEHRYCTECMIQGEGLDRRKLLAQLKQLDSSSAVIAGDSNRLRVHIHVDEPEQVFQVCGRMGVLDQQKADDMLSQAQAAKRAGQVVVVADTGADIPEQMIGELGIQRVPLRFNFAGHDYLDRVSMNIASFYKRLAQSKDAPQTSQPPVGDYRRMYELLRGQGSQVLNVSVSASLSGTYQAAVAAAGDDQKIQVFDSANGSAGQGLLAIAAAEMADQGLQIAEIVPRLNELKKNTITYVTTRNLDYAARGGRVPVWLAKVARYLHIQPVLCTTIEGLLKPKGAMLSTSNPVPGFTRWLLRRLDKNKHYRLMVTHGDNHDAAVVLRNQLLARLPQVKTCWISETGPAIGVHAGPGVLVVGVQEWEQH